MDPISASCLNLNTKDKELSVIEKTDQKYQQILGSCVSISNYEEKNLKNLCPQIFAAILVTSYHLVLGISLAYSAILLPQLQEKPDFEVSTTGASWIASVVALTTPAGSLIVGFLMDRFGRLNTLRMSALPSMASWVITALSQNIGMMIFARALIGFSCALGSNPAIVYLTEIARKDMRGSLISFAPTLTSLGMVLTFILGWYLNWRQVAWICVAFSALPCLLVTFIPESPAWLVSKNRIDEARKSLIWINKYQPQPEDKTATLAELQLALLQKEHELKLIRDSQRRGGIYMIIREFLKPTGYKPLLILSGMFVLQQFTGIFIFLFYSINFFQEVSSSINPYFASIFIGVLRFIMSLINTYLQKTVKRRTSMMISCTLMSIFIFITAFSTKWNKDGTATYTWLPVVFLLLFVVASMVGLVPIPYTMGAELFPLEVRGVAHSIVFCIASFLMFISLQVYPLLYQSLGGMVGLFYFFSAICLGSVAYIYVFFPETHKKKLSEIEEYFMKNWSFIGQKKTNESNGMKLIRQKSIVRKRPELQLQQSLLEEA